MSITSTSSRGVRAACSVAKITALSCVIFALCSAGTPPLHEDFVPVTEVPRMIYQENPVYPDTLKKAGIEGEVWIRALLDTNGNVKEAVVRLTSGNEMLDKSAIVAAYKNKFTPAKCNGKFIRYWVMYKVSFKIAKTDSIKN